VNLEGQKGLVVMLFGVLGEAADKSVDLGDQFLGDLLNVPAQITKEL
jgi:hypothetical protein